jgi:hypothetical protein
MSNDTKALKNANSTVLFANKRRKNTYQPLEAGAYPRQFIKQLKTANEAVLTGDLSLTKMVREDKRSGRYLLSIGLGAKHTGIKNGYIPRGEFAAYASLAEVAEGIQALYSLAIQGEFDEELEALREKRQKHAEKMISRRKVDSFLMKGEVSRRNAMLPEEQLNAAA